MKTSISRIKAFTLIELLTVIAIIGILAAILIPVVASVRESAREAQCRSNLRQLAMGANAYEVENGHFPYAFRFGEGDLNWWNTMRPYVAGMREGESVNFASGTELVGEVLECPSRAEVGDRGPVKISYAPNEMVMRRNDQSPRRMENIREPSRIVIFTDATQTSNGWANTSLTLLPGGRQNPGLPSPRNAEDPLNIPELKDGEQGDGTSISFRHGDDERANVAFVDGHVQSIRRGDLKNNNFIIWD